ncbi:MAG: single-stranded-DNA-specific exonuclease RecJ [Deltaproteobacteria bacterium]|nr:single-stranded-DNA-specific exonuclease RecJ [Deltaproteobacteria bacterium]
MKHRWLLKAPDPDNVESMSRSLGVSKPIATILINRDLEEIEKAHLFLKGSLKDLPSPFLMKDMKKAVDRIVLAMERKESIFVYGDYDVDGTTATALLLTFFKELGILVQFHIPHRLREGYGLHAKALEEIRAQGGRVVITADCGISNVAEAQVASQLGVDLIVTDHHIIPPALPDAHAVLNPLRADSDFPDLHLSGVGVVFFLVMALRQTLRETNYFSQRKEPNLRNYLDFVALGTIADLVPLKGVNHILVKEGLSVLSTQKRIAVNALCEVSGISDKKIGTYEVGFQLAPRLNAAGRLQTATLAVKLLTSDDYHEALAVARVLNEENQKRRFLQDEIFHQAVTMVEEKKLHLSGKSLVLSSPHWHPGVIGIVASKLVEKYYLPTCLISEQETMGKGSCRSISALHLYQALKACADQFETFGGHKAAAGFAIPLNRIDSFRRCFDEVVRKMVSPDDFTPVTWVDLRVTLAQVDRELIEDLALLEPFGMGNPEPVFLCEGFKVARHHIVAEKHLKLWLQDSGQQQEAIGFQLSHHAGEVHKMKSVLFSPRVNEWNGTARIQLRVKEFGF